MCQAYGDRHRLPLRLRIVGGDVACTFYSFPSKGGRTKKFPAFFITIALFREKSDGEADLPDQLGRDLLAFRQHFHQLLYFGRARLGFFSRLDSEDDGIAVHAV